MKNSSKQTVLVSAYDRAKEFLIKQMPVDASEAETVLDHYLALPDNSHSPVSLNKLYQRLLVSAQNANMKTSVIGGALGGVEKLALVLFDFCPKAVAHEFGDDAGRVLSEIEEKLKPAGRIRKSTASIWPRYCRTILSAAHFLKQFESGDEFYDWANHLYRDQRSIAALPLILAQEVFGIGYPLACDFLKELGFINYGKPDVHIIEIFAGLGLCDVTATPYEFQKIIGQIADAKGVSAYNADKLFWLIGSGKFYDHQSIGNIGSLKKGFLEQAGTII